MRELLIKRFNEWKELTGIKVGDQVKITRMPNLDDDMEDYWSYNYGYNYIEDSLESVLTVDDIDIDSLSLSDGCTYPFYILEIVETIELKIGDYVKVGGTLYHLKDNHPVSPSHLRGYNALGEILNFTKKTTQYKVSTDEEVFAYRLKIAQF